MANIAFIGLGAMGTRMATKLFEAGHNLTVWNRTKEKTESFKQRGARVAPTPAEAAQNADFVISMVRDDAASREIWLDEVNGAAKTMQADAIAIESSTISPDWAKRLSEELEREGVNFLESPVSGSLPQADAAALVFLVGGNEALIEPVEPILKLMGEKVFHTGDIGTAATMKLAINSLLAAQVAMLGETMAFIEANGIDAERAAEIISAVPVSSPAAGFAVNSIANRNYTPLFPIELVTKDLGYALEAGEHDLPLTNKTAEIFKSALEKGFGRDNISGVAQIYQSNN